MSKVTAGKIMEALRGVAWNGDAAAVADYTADWHASRDLVEAVHAAAAKVAAAVVPGQARGPARRVAIDEAARLAGQYLAAPPGRITDAEHSLAARIRDAGAGGFNSPEDMTAQRRMARARDAVDSQLGGSDVGWKQD